jgi:hypothetical protein
MGLLPRVVIFLVRHVGESMRLLILATLLPSLLAAPAMAEESKADSKACDGSINWDVRIAACTRLIANPEADKEGRAYALFNRGFGWAQKRDFDRAIADYTASINIDAKSEHVFSIAAVRGSPKARWIAPLRTIARQSVSIRNLPRPITAAAWFGVAKVISCARSLIWTRHSSSIRKFSQADGSGRFCGFDNARAISRRS